MSKKNKKKSNLEILLILVVVFIAILLILYLINNGNTQQNVPKPIEVNDIQNGINYSPPTEEEKKAGEDAKQRIIQKESNQIPVQPNVTPIISSAGYYDGNVEISAFIPGIYEEGGACTLKLTKDSNIITKTVIAEKDATVVRCNNFIVDSSELITGSWQASVSYSSNNHNGTSEIKTVDVP